MNEVGEATWRKRFILVNLVTIGGTVMALFGILLWQTDYVVQGGSAIGFVLAMLGLVISFFAPRVMASRWKRGDRS